MKIFCLALPAILGSMPILAQNPMLNDSLPDSRLEEIVISANKTEEHKSDIPQQIAVISARKIAQLNPMTTGDLLQNGGLAFVQKSQQGGGSPVLRGFEANKVLLVVDGVRMNNAIYRGGHLQNVITVDPAALDRVEVLYGAGSVIYGTDAIGGVISLFTKRPQLSQDGKPEVRLNAFARYATVNNGATAHLNFNLGGKKWANYLAVTGNEFGDLRSGTRDQKCDTCRSGKYDNFGDRPFYVGRINGRDSIFTNNRPDVQKQSGYRQIDVLEKFLFAPGGPHRHTINIQYSNSTNVPRYDRLTEKSGGKPRFAEWYYGPQERLLASYQLGYEVKSRVADLIRLTPAFQKIEESRYDRRLNNNKRNERVEDLKIFSANLDIFKKAGEHEIRYGAELVSNQLKSRGVLRDIIAETTAPLVSRYPDGSYSTTGIYASHRWEIAGEKFILSDGLRFSAVNMNVDFDPEFFTIENLRNVRQSSSSLNFNLGATCKPVKNIRFSALASSGFRNPNIDDAAKVFENAGGTLNIPNPDLKPEQVLYGEFGADYRVSEIFELGIAVFQSNLTDAIATRATTYNGQNFIVWGSDTLLPVHSANVNKAIVKGFTVQASGRAAGFAYGASFAWTEGRDKTNDLPLDHVPPVTGRVRFGYERPAWRAETDLLFNGWKRIEDYSPSGEDNAQYATPDGTPAWQIWNVRGSWKFSQKWRVQAAVENILDLNYRVFASGINGAGRNFVVGLYYGG